MKPVPFRIKWRLLPWVLLACGLTFSVLIFAYLEYSREKTDEKHFNQMVETSKLVMEERLKSYDLAFKGSLALFSASKSVGSKEWTDYVASLDLSKNLPGLSSLGVVFAINDEDLNKFLDQRDTTSISPMEIKYLNGQKPSEHFIVTYLEPNPWKEKAIGLDLASERNRRLAAEVARDSGQPKATEIVRFVVRPKNNLGLIYYVPIYQNGASLQNSKERKSAHLGFVIAPLFISDFFKDFFKEITQELDLDVYDGKKAKKEAWLYSKNQAPKPDHEHTSLFEIGGKSFTIAWNRSPQFTSASRQPIFWITFLSLLMTAASVYIANIHQRRHQEASRIAEEIRMELLKTQEALVQSQKMEAVGQLVSGISHDFNNVLGGIIGYASLLKSHIVDLPRSGYHLQQIINNAQLGSSMLKDLLGFVRKEKAVKHKISFNHIARMTESLVVTSLQKNIKLTFDLAPDLKEIEADSGQMTQVLLNLCINARDAMPEGGQITIGSENTHEGIHVWVRDTGTGIAPEIQKKIFEAFFTTKTEGKGTGLGLSMVSEIIRNHGGSISLESTVGQGTCFHIHLPEGQAVIAESSAKQLTREAPMAAR